MHIKTVKVTNAKNVLVQLPGFVVTKWQLNENDGVAVYISEDEESIILRPRKSYARIGGFINRSST